MKKRYIILILFVVLSILVAGLRDRYDFGGGAFVQWLQLDINWMDGFQEGRFQWNAEDGVPEIGLPGGSVNLQIGQEMVDRATNDEGETINNGEAVFISGGTGSFSDIQTPIASDADEAPRTYALATESIDNAQKGYVTLVGKVRDINTTGSLVSETWANGDIIYLSAITEGALTNVRPTPPNIGVIIGVVLRAHATEGVIGVNPVVIQRVSLASDVIITNIQDGDVLTWDAGTGVWRNVAP
jgi:hypothetical protein